MNSFGNKLKISIFGESHGAVVGVVIDGMRPGIPLAESDFTADLERRRSGDAATTLRREPDRPELISGVHNGVATGAPVTVIFRNTDVQSADYVKFTHHPRPSHADYAASVKYGGFNDPRGGGQFSGRMTVALVAAGVVAKKMLGHGIEVNAYLLDKEDVISKAKTAAERGDSVGGVVECVATGLPAGLGEPFFDSVESVAAHLLFSIPAVRGVEFGAGFAAAKMTGSEHNDLIISADGTTATNHAGGVVGGLTNGNPLVVRVAVKPAASISQPRETFNFATQRIETLKINGRHDACIALRMPVIVEAAVAIALAQF
jgi:chorismate synthase